MKAQKLRCPQTDINNSKCPQKALQGNVTLFPVINFSITLKFCEPFFRRKEISVHDYSAGMSHFGWSIVPVSDGNLTSFNTIGATFHKHKRLKSFLNGEALPKLLSSGGSPFLPQFPT